MRAAPHPAYGELSGRFFRATAAEYEYEVSLFSYASQGPSGGRRSGSSTVSLGKRWAWQHAVGQVGAVGELSGGDWCAGASVHRSLTLHFACAADGDRLGKVAERSTCRYEATFWTPAAC